MDRLWQPKATPPVRLHTLRGIRIETAFDSIEAVAIATQPQPGDLFTAGLRRVETESPPLLKSCPQLSTKYGKKRLDNHNIW
jgi:hypothetical protein